MINALPSISQIETPSASAPQATPATNSASQSQKTVQSQAPSAAPVDTVQISNNAQAALKEVLETSAQTAKEAAHGDHQAQRLLAKETAASKA
jgi:hypothetical protein